MNNRLSDSEVTEESTPAIEAQREVLRVIAEEINLERWRIAFSKRLQQSVNYGEESPKLADEMQGRVDGRSSDDAEIAAILRQGIVSARARQGSLYVEKIHHVRPTLKARARPRRKSERR